MQPKEILKQFRCPNHLTQYIDRIYVQGDSINLCCTQCSSISTSNYLNPLSLIYEAASYSKEMLKPQQLPEDVQIHLAKLLKSEEECLDRLSAHIEKEKEYITFSMGHLVE